MEYKFEATLNSIKKDREGEVTISFKVSLTEADKTILIPVQTPLYLTIKDDQT